jgi:endonuclease/exonuclease/phosphatase family metal-dependent hydrolase
MGKLKLVVYNIQYGAGIDGYFDYFNLKKYFKEGKNIISKIGANLKKLKPDVLGLIEVDNGSCRNKNKSQVQRLSELIGMKYLFTKCKYSKLISQLPILGSQNHALISKFDIKKPKAYSFQQGAKKLIMISKIKGINFILTHLSLSKKIRKQQYYELSLIVNKLKGKTVLMGDFNAEPEELKDLCALTKLKLIEHNKTFPSWQPTKNLDHILVSKNIKVKNLLVLKWSCSDHLPVYVEIEY